MWFEVPVYLYLLFSLLLLPYGYNCLVLVYGALKYKTPAAKHLKTYPHVSIHLPVYNEKNVVDRLLTAVSSLDWPKNKLDIMILDDSNDETKDIIDQKVEKIRETGCKVQVVRRNNREGFKAGALREGLSKTTGKYIVVFDADFIPKTSYLKDVIPYLEQDDSIGFVQTRWGHINRLQNRFTKAFSIALDAHHMVDQAGRYTLGLLMSFNGSSGAIRTSAARSVGGWTSDTLSEDLDMSYKLQLAGCKGVYLRDVVTDGQLPSNLRDFRTQQSRWAKGSTQCARKYLLPVWKNSNLSLFQKIQSSIQLTNYSISLLMLMLVLTEIFMIGSDFVIKQSIDARLYFDKVILDPRLGTLFTICTLCTLTYYFTALKTQGLSIRRDGSSILFLALIAYGFSAICGVSIFEGIFTRGGVFERIPKYSVNEIRANLNSQSYRSKLKHIEVERILTVVSALSLLLSYIMNILPATSYLFVYLFGYYFVSLNL
jgi:cellulose synthase/poly-beta-1,6-N-acetylglucosamine synthase-like glycosyltransferase